MTSVPQPAILAPVPLVGRSLVFRLWPEVDPTPTLAAFAAAHDPAWGAVGLGAPVAAALGMEVPGLWPFPALVGPAGAVPSTQGALWLLLRGDDPGTLHDRTEAVAEILAPAFVLDDDLHTFRYRDGRDLTGYLDGTANPADEAAEGVALVAEGEGMIGSSFVSVQRWMHDLDAFRAWEPAERDAMIGRALDDNEEIEDAPESAHVKRTAQELYDPTAFMVRRSMPWADASGKGLEFVAYCASVDPFERMLAHMLGCDDGIVDALFRFSRPITGGHYWCPSLTDGRLDLSVLGM